MATNNTQRSADEQIFWDGIFAERFPACMKSFKQRKPEYCAHAARDQADAALAERRRSAAADTAARS